MKLHQSVPKGALELEKAFTSKSLSGVVTGTITTYTHIEECPLNPVLVCEHISFTTTRHTRGASTNTNKSKLCTYRRIKIS